MHILSGKVYPIGDFIGVAGVKVTEAGSGNSVMTSTSGSFTLVASSPSAVIEFTKSGFLKKTIVASSFSQFVNISPDFDNPTDLDEVVIISDQRNNTFLYLAIATVVAVGGYFAFRKKKPQPQKVKV